MRPHCYRNRESVWRAPGVVAWQIDNEYGCHDTVESYSGAALHAFRQWCAKKYGSIDALNQAWGNVFWSMELSSFDEIELPNLTVTEANPSHRLNFQRFSSDQVVAFNQRQVRILRRYSPGRTILHNFMRSSTAFDHYAVSEDLDAAAWDSYPLGYLERGPRDDAFKQRYLRVGDPDYQAFHHDLHRACGHGRWWVMEQQPGPVNWAPWNPSPAKGAVRLWTYEAFAAGAEVVSYFRWRQAPFAQEQMHEALLLPNAEPNEAYHVVAQISQELTKLDAHVETERSAIALVFDYESEWAWNIQPHGQDFSYLELVMTFYRGLRRAGVSVDLIPPASEAVVGRKLVLLPGLFAPRADLVEALVKCGAAILMGPRSGSKTPDFHIPANLPPGSLSILIDLKVRHVESLRPGIVIPIAGCDTCHFESWREFLVLGERVEAVLNSADGEVALATIAIFTSQAAPMNLSSMTCYATSSLKRAFLRSICPRTFASAIMAQFALSSTTAEKQWIFPKSSVRRRFYWGRDSFHLVASQSFDEPCRRLRVRRGRRPNKEPAAFSKLQDVQSRSSGGRRTKKEATRSPTLTIK